MPIDMPPSAPAYEISRPAPAPSAWRDTVAAVSSARKAVSDRVAAAFTPEPSPMQRALPQLDPRSAALTPQDRQQLVGAMQANWRGDLSQGARSSSTYVGERIRLAVGYAQAMDAMNRGALDSSTARDLHCRMVAVALDRRAGAYVQGGEAAAARARASVSREDLARCSPAIARAQAAQAARAVPEAAPRAVDPQARAARFHLDLASTQPAKVRIDLAPAHRVRIDPRGSERVGIDPVVRNAVFQSAQRGSGGRGA